MNMNKLKTIYAILLTTFVMILPSSGFSSTVVGIKPFSIYIENYHCIKDNVSIDDKLIGKRIKVIEFDGTDFHFCKMGLVRIDGDTRIYGPKLDKDFNPIPNKPSDKDYFESLHDMMNTLYSYIYEGTESIFISLFSPRIHEPTNNNLAFKLSRWEGKIVRSSLKNNVSKNVAASIAIIDQKFQYQYYELINNNWIQKKILAINPDKYDSNLPFLSTQLSILPINKSYISLSKDTTDITVGGKYQRYFPPVMVSRGSRYYVSVYDLSKLLGYGVLNDKQNAQWKILQIVNPTAYELKINEITISINDKSSVSVNNNNVRLEMPWINVDRAEEPYFSLRDFSLIFGIKYSYRDIDKSVIIPQ